MSICKYCGAEDMDHDYQHLARECYPLQIKAVVAEERERCALIAISFGDFPGGRLIKDLRIMCGNAIADKIREDPLPDGKRS